MKSKTITGMCGLFGGGIGLQFFYLGRVDLGLCCLMFCWTFIPMIIGVLHACYILSMDQYDFDKKYNKQFNHPAPE